ncbi:hypothetical protein K1719_045250 [Acacia pycnantha]|nr:hypothetical protein K1719_045250 [Acacia pycnantha]
MSYQSKGFWTLKGTGHINDRDTAFDNPSKIEPKRTHRWFIDAAEVDFFSQTRNKQWKMKMKNQTKMICNQYREDASEETEALLSFDGIKEVKTNRVKDFDIIQAEARYNLVRQDNSDLHQAYNGEPEMGYMSIGQAFDKGSNVSLMELSSNRADAHVRSLGEAYGKGYDNAVSVGDSYNKEDTNTISFRGFPDEQDIFPVDRPFGDFFPLYILSSVQVSTTADERVLNASNSNGTVSIPLVDKLKPEPVSKNNPELKAAKREAPNSFPSNCYLLSYVYEPVWMKELRGIIKGPGYLCGCQLCNYSKVLNACEFERHAGCKTKHPNNHIYFENGKTIYQTVQELRSSPEKSFQEATHELQRIYGKNRQSI